MRRENVNKTNNKKDDMTMAVLNMLNRDEGSSTISSSEEDEEVQQARAQLLATKMERKRIRKQEKLKQIALETERINLSMRKLKAKQSEGSSKKKKKVTIKTLRKSDDVMEEVEELMDKNLNIEVDSSDVDTTSTCSDDSTTSTSSEEEKKKKLKKKERRAKKKAGLHRSGKSKKLTSFVKYPQMWAPYVFESEFCQSK